MPAGTPKKIVVEGIEYNLRTWAETQGWDYGTVLKRWQAGERDPKKLIPYSRKSPISEADIAWLKETQRARAGMPDEWELACDLIGQPRGRAKEIKNLMHREMI